MLLRLTSVLLLVTLVGLVNAAGRSIRTSQPTDDGGSSSERTVSPPTHFAFLRA